MNKQYRLYGWNASHFSTKLRAYLTCKQLDFVQKDCSLYDLVFLLPKRIGSSSMPALQTPEGEWLSDTPEIIERLESRHGNSPFTPGTPRQLIAALLLENWVDDTWLKISVHTRWSYPENFENGLKQETGQALLPFAPKAVREFLSKKLFAEKIQRYMPGLGVVPEQIELLEKWALNLLDLLDSHFRQHEFILGDKPSVADFALAGAVCGHLARDTWPRLHWIENRESVLRWSRDIFCFQNPKASYPEQDRIPETLTDIFEIIAQEYFPLIETTVQRVRHFCLQERLKSGDVLPRVIRDCRYPMLGETFSSGAFTYSLWRMQRLQKSYDNMPDVEKRSVDQWFGTLRLSRLPDMDFGPALARQALGTRLL